MTKEQQLMKEVEVELARARSLFKPIYSNMILDEHKEEHEKLA